MYTHINRCLHMIPIVASYNVNGTSFLSLVTVSINILHPVWTNLYSHWKLECKMTKRLSCCSFSPNFRYLLWHYHSSAWVVSHCRKDGTWWRNPIQTRSTDYVHERHFLSSMKLKFLHIKIVNTAINKRHHAIFCSCLPLVSMFGINFLIRNIVTGCSLNTSEWNFSIPKCLYLHNLKIWKDPFFFLQRYI